MELIFSLNSSVYLDSLFTADIYSDWLDVHSDQLLNIYWALQIFVIIPVICSFVKMCSWLPLIVSQWTQLNHSHQVWRGLLWFSNRLHRTICFIDVHKNKDIQSFKVYLSRTWRICEIAGQIRQTQAVYIFLNLSTLSLFSMFSHQT